MDTRMLKGMVMMSIMVASGGAGAQSGETQVEVVYENDRYPVVVVYGRESVDDTGSEPDDVVVAIDDRGLDLIFTSETRIGAGYDAIRKDGGYEKSLKSYPRGGRVEMWWDNDEVVKVEPWIQISPFARYTTQDATRDIQVCGFAYTNWGPTFYSAVERCREYEARLEERIVPMMAEMVRRLCGGEKLTIDAGFTTNISVPGLRSKTGARTT